LFFVLAGYLWGTSCGPPTGAKGFTNCQKQENAETGDEGGKNEGYDDDRGLAIQRWRIWTGNNGAGRATNCHCAKALAVGDIKFYHTPIAAFRDKSQSSLKGDRDG
jgi:hypothetical protein